MLSTIKVAGQVAVQVITNRSKEKIIEQLEMETMPEANKKTQPIPQTQVKQVNQLLAEIKDLVKRENSRDRKRFLFELYDRHYKKIIAGMGGVALVATAASGIAAATALSHPADLTTNQMLAQIAAPVFGTLLAGSGLVNLLVRAGYFMDCNGKFQDARRGRDIELESNVKQSVYEKMREIRAINDSQSYLPPGRLKWRLICKISHEINGIRKYIKKMEQRDHKIEMKEKQNPGREPSNTRRRVKAKELVKNEFDKKGIGQYFGYFADPEGEIEGSGSKTASLMSEIAEPKDESTELESGITELEHGIVELEHGIVELERKMARLESKTTGSEYDTLIDREEAFQQRPMKIAENPNRVSTARMKLQQTCAQMQAEMVKPTFPALYRKTSTEVQRFLRNCGQPDETQYTLAK